MRTEGALTLRGQAGATQVTYTLKRRVHAGSLQQAERFLNEFEIRLHNTGPEAILQVTTPRSRIHGADLTLTVPANLTLATLETLGGNLAASDFNGELQAATAAGILQVDRLGANAFLRTGGGEIRVGHVAGGVRCTSGGGNIELDSAGKESWFETAGGDIRIHQAGGSVHASTAGGNIRVDRSGGDVYAHTAGGVIEVQEAAGLVTADNSGGSIQVSASKGVRCESEAGAIRLKNFSSGSMRATTAVGNILAELLSGAHLQDSLLRTNLGDVTVFLWSNIPVTVQARNDTAGAGGRIVSEFPQIRVRAASVNNVAQLIAEGALNGGGPILKIYASGGTIYLRRQN